MLAIAPVLRLLQTFIWPRDVFDTKNGDAQQALMMLFVSAIVRLWLVAFSSMPEIVK